MRAERVIRFRVGHVGYTLGVDPDWPMHQVAEACAFRAGLSLGTTVYELVPCAGGYLLTAAGSLSAEEKAALLPPPAAPAPSPAETLLDLAFRMAQDLQEYADAAEEADPGSCLDTKLLIEEFDRHPLVIAGGSA